MRPLQGESYFFDRFKAESRGKPLQRKVEIQGLSVYIESGEKVSLLSVGPDAEKKELTGKRVTENNFVEKTDASGKRYLEERVVEEGEKKPGEKRDSKKEEKDLGEAMQNLSKHIHESPLDVQDETAPRPCFLLKPLTVEVTLFQQTVDLGTE